jgi:purine-binding chemotaxis protein CheW
MTAQTGLLGPDLPDAGEASAALLFLVFRMDGREHALPIEHVVEVVRMVAITRMPEAPPWVSGVINFRGQVIPLVDVRIRLGAPRRAPDLSTPIVVVKTSEIVAGLVVDEVVEVLAIRSESVDPPSHATAVSTAVSGVAREGDRLIFVLDRDRICDGAVDLSLTFTTEDR